MLPADNPLLLSAAADVTPQEQAASERALLAAAGLGALHLHISTLSGERLGLGAFHAALPEAGERVWRRHTGGRAIAVGEGFLLVSLFLPHRSALVAAERYALRPEQVLNRGVRGILAWLRTLGLDPVYPGLDFLTVGGRRLAHLSFCEYLAGPTLVQAVIARETSLAETMLRLDRFDPTGVIPALAWSPDESTTLARLGQRDAATLSPGATLGPLAEGFRSTFGLGVGLAELHRLQAANASPAISAIPAAAHGAQQVQVEGRLGPILAWIEEKEGIVNHVSLGGDLIAPEGMAEALQAALCGSPADPARIKAAVEKVFDGQRGYALGLDRAGLEDLLGRAWQACR
ncbi:MAG: hypothetical protein VCC00_09435 [Deltaproteobacteria bacterium]